MRRIVVKEEFIKLTKSFTGAIVLDYLVELKKTLSNKDKSFPINLTEMLKETMLDISELTLRREIKKLVKNEFLIEIKDEKRHQYKINNSKIQDEFRKLGIIKEIKNFIEEKEFVDFDGNVYTQTEMDIKKFRENHEMSKINTHVNHTAIEDKSQDNYEKISEFIKENIEYDIIVTNNKEVQESKMLDRLYRIILEVLTTNSKFIRINRNKIPSTAVKSIFKKINSNLLLEVVFKLKRVNNKIINFKNYIITVIYNTYLEEEFETQNNFYSNNANGFINYVQPKYDFKKLRELEIRRLKEIAMQ